MIKGLQETEEEEDCVETVSGLRARNDNRRKSTIQMPSEQHCHTVRNLHFLSKNSTLISREKGRFFWGEKLVKMLWFWTF